MMEGSIPRTAHIIRREAVRRPAGIYPLSWLRRRWRQCVRSCLSARSSERSDRCYGRSVTVRNDDWVRDDCLAKTCQRETCEPRRAQVKINFEPATRTAARRTRKVSVATRRTPSSLPTSPPTTAAPAHSGSADGKAFTLARFPASAAAELTRMNAAETPPVSRVSAHPVNRRRGLRKIPPPVPVSPTTSQ